MAKATITNIEGLAEALTILAKYDEEGCYDFQHDQMWAGNENAVNNISDEDKSRLEELGWFVDESVDCWSKFS